MAGCAVAPRSDWSLLSRTRGSDRTSLTRTRRLFATPALEEHRKVAVRHPDERYQSRKLLTDPDRLVTMITRPRNSCTWGAMGAALRQCDDRPTDRSCPYLLNEGWDCFELDSAFPEFSAVASRALPSKVKSRLVFEIAAEPSARQHIAQVGLAQVGGDPCELRAGRLDKSTPLLESFVYTSSGDLLSSDGDLEIIDAGSLPGLRFRRENWCSGAPSWLSSEKSSVRVMMEVDLRKGWMAISLGEWAANPVVVSIPALVAGDDKQWLPFVSLTAVGQSARILDFHVSVEA